MATKHCHNCKHLEWVDGDTDDCSGFICNKVRRNEPIELDDARTVRMESEAYRMRAKVCFVAQEPRPNGQ